jgi:hypothetical protein
MLSAGTPEQWVTACAEPALHHICSEAGCVAKAIGFRGWSGWLVQNMITKAAPGSFNP